MDDVLKDELSDRNFDYIYFCDSDIAVTADIDNIFEIDPAEDEVLSLKLKHVFFSKWSMSAFVSVRGPFSQRVCEELGLSGTHLFGCPSAMINPNPILGRSIERKLRSLGETPSVSFGLAAAVSL